MGLEYTGKIITEGLSLYLNAADNNSFNGSGTTWYDVSGENNNGTLVNGTTFSPDISRGVFAFDGSNDYVNIGVNKSCNVLTGDFTVSAWANRSNAGVAWGNVIGDYYTNNTFNNNEWQIMMSNGGAFFLYIIGIGYLITTSNFGANQWHNVVVTRIGSTITMYVNGTSVDTVTNTSTFGTTTGNLNIGVNGNNSAEPFTGKISNILIYKNKGLTSSEVIQNYNATKTRFGI